MLLPLPSQHRNIPLWRCAKQTAVFTAELGRAFISDLESGAGYVLVFIELQTMGGAGCSRLKKSRPVMAVPYV
jgi:hypothetical protein